MQTVAETSVFARKAAALLTDEEKWALIAYLAANPLAGVLIQGTGGLRKLRFGAGNSGKSGGVRTIYYFAGADMPVYALLLYGKNERADLSSRQRDELAALAAEIKASWKRRRRQ